MPTVATAGFISGTIILKNMPHTLHPSIQADSSSSRGISFINPVQTSIAMARENAAYGIISAQRVFRRCILDNVT